MQCLINSCFTKLFWGEIQCSPVSLLVIHSTNIYCVCVCVCMYVCMHVCIHVALLTYTMFKHLSSNKEKKPESDLGPVFPESFGFFRAMRGEQGKGRWRLREAWETGAEGGVDRWMGGRDGGRTGVMPQGQQGGAQRGKGQNWKWWTMNSAWNTASGHLYTAIRPQKLCPPPPHTHTVYQNYPKPVI